MHLFVLFASLISQHCFFFFFLRDYHYHLVDFLKSKIVFSEQGNGKRTGLLCGLIYSFCSFSRDLTYETFVSKSSTELYKWPELSIGSPAKPQGHLKRFLLLSMKSVVLFLVLA